MQTLDFTTRRKGSRTPECNGRKIDICPKCGKNGVVTVYTNSKTQKRTTEYWHKGYLEIVAGMPFTSIQEGCMIRESVKNG